MMEKQCLVCKKKIRTGYKYCQEHRNTKVINILKKEDALIKEAEEAYIEYYIDKKMQKVSFFIKLMIKKEDDFKKEAIDNINNKDSEWIEFAKNYISEVKEKQREEENYRRSLLGYEEDKEDD